VFASAALLTSMTAGELRIADTRNEITLAWEAGWGTSRKHGGTAELRLSRAVNAFFLPFGAVEYTDEEGDDGAETVGAAGVRYLLPLLIWTEVRVDTGGALGVSFEKELPLLPRLELHGAAEYDSHEGWEGEVGLSYAVSRAITLLGGWHSDHGWGGGVGLSW
jgi:hypothetical protein